MRRLTVAAVLAFASLLTVTSMSFADEDLKILIKITRQSTDGSGTQTEELVMTIGEGKRGIVRLGSRIAIPATTFNAQTGEGSIAPITSFTYQNVGLDAELTIEQVEGDVHRVSGKIEESSLEPGSSPQPQIANFELAYSTLIEPGRPRTIFSRNSSLTGSIRVEFELLE